MPGTCIINIFLKRNKPMAIKPSAIALKATFTKLPKTKRWSVTVDGFFPIRIAAKHKALSFAGSSTVPVSTTELAISS